MLLVCLESSSCKLTMNLLDRGIDWSNIIYPEFKLLDDRIRSFSEKYWPSFINLNANVLANAGFFYTGYGDIVVCAYCGLNLYKWNTKDIPLIEHAKYNKNCVYISLFQSDIIKLTKNSNLIGKVKSSFIDFKDLLFVILYKINTFFYNVIRNRNNNFIDYRCKICFDNVATILVLPCSHISTCISCATCILYCPICRCNIKTLVKVYFS